MPAASEPRTAQKLQASRPGYFGPYGGQFVPETLIGPLRDLIQAFETARHDPAFWEELRGYLDVGYRLGLLLADLNVKPAGSGGGQASIEATLHDGSRSVRLSIAGSGPSGVPVRELRIETADAVLTVQLHEESGHMHVREDLRGVPVRRTVERLPADDAMLLAEALDDRIDSAIFLDALRSALILLGD